MSELLSPSVLSLASATIAPVVTSILLPSALTSVPASFTAISLTLSFPSTVLALPVNVTLLPSASVTSITASPVSFATALPSSVYVLPSGSVYSNVTSPVFVSSFAALLDVSALTVTACTVVSSLFAVFFPQPDETSIVTITVVISVIFNSFFLIISILSQM